MSPRQHKWYLREWGAAFARHWCGSKGGQVLARPGRQASPVRDSLVAIAGQIAAQLPDGRLSADVLRHACHVAALGKDVSSLRMSNKQLDLVIAFFRRLAEDGKDLAGQIRLDARGRELERQTAAKANFEAGCGDSAPWRAGHPDADRKRVTWSLIHSGYPEAAIAAIARDKFATTEWRGLPDRELYELLLTVKDRAARRETTAAIAFSGISC